MGVHQKYRCELKFYHWVEPQGMMTVALIHRSCMRYTQCYIPEPCDLDLSFGPIHNANIAMNQVSVNLKRLPCIISPPMTSTNSDPAIARKGTWASVATAFAKRVFPHPGGPKSNEPLGTLAPSWRYLSGFYKIEPLCQNKTCYCQAYEKKKMKIKKQNPQILFHTCPHL